jgi:DNA-binding response OmpR family regulator
MNVLVLDDDANVAEVMVEALASRGHRCHVAGRARDADLIVRGQPIDAAVIDVGLPGRSGIDWLEDLSALRPDIARRSLVVTGDDLPVRERERVSRCGAALLVKPFSTWRLVEVLQHKASIG